MDLIQNALSEGFITGTISGARKGFNPEVKKIILRAVAAKGGTTIQFTYLLADRATHENLPPLEAAQRLCALLRDGGYAQALLCTAVADLHVTHYGKLKIRKTPPTKMVGATAHNRKKEHAVDTAASYLDMLGVTKNGVVLPAMKGKFRQINAFIELSAPLIPTTVHPVRVVDFGCGKAYLTFALYHHITTVMKRKCHITGVDLKSDVLAECAHIAERLGFDQLRFVDGDIKNADSLPDLQSPDMVVALHACDGATDLALDWAVARGAETIIAVPCCQHELFGRINSDVLRPMLRGVLRERVAALVTDALRAQRLEASGYKCEAVEFVDTEHTPKNIMLRAVKRPNTDRAEAGRLLRRFMDAWAIDNT